MSMNDFLANPMTSFGLGLLGGNYGRSKGAAFSNAMRGGLLGLESARRNQFMQQQAQMQQAQFQMAKQKAEQAKKDREENEKWIATLPPNEQALARGNPELYKSQRLHMLKVQNPTPTTNQFGTTVQYVKDRSGRVLPAQASQAGGVFITNPDGSRSPFDPSKHQLIKPYSMQDFGGHIAPVQPLTGQVGAGPIYSNQQGGSLPPPIGGPYLEPGETLSPQSQYQPTGGVYPKTLAPGERPQTKALQAAATKEGAAQGEAVVSYKDRLARLPRLHSLVDELSALGKTATYTRAGQAFNTIKREMGMDPGEGAVARKEYISKVDNEILPLLRQTFGSQFTEKEGQSLKATLGDPNASPEEKDAVLRSFIKTKEEELRVLATRAGIDAAQNKGQNISRDTLRPGMVVDGYRYTGGDPADRNSWAKQ